MGLSECWKRRHAIAGGLLLGLTIALSGVAGAQEVPQQARAATGWSIPSDEVIRALLRERMAANGVGIVVGIVGPDGRRVITHGRSGAPDGRPLDGDTIFQIGSVTKVFTTLLLSKMALDGEVGIEDAAAKYLPAGTRMPEKGSPITLADLATHMSGLPSMPTNFDLSARPDPVEAYSADDLAAFLATYSPEREPGAAYAYSNLGVALLGRLLSAKAGRPYEQLLRESVLQPLGLADTSISLSADQVRRLAPGHDRYLHPVHSMEMTTLPGSGSLRSSTNDLLAFLEACLGYRKTSLDEALRFQREAMRRSFPGGVQMLGWSERVSQGVTIVGHDGGKEGYRAAILFNPATREGIVILANARTDDTPIALAAHLLTGRSLGPAPVAPRQERTVLSPDVMDRYAGVYALPSGALMRIARKDDHLLVDMVGNGVTDFHPSSATEFHSNTSNETLRFRPDSFGAVVGLDYVVGTRSFAAMRDNP